MWEASGSRLGSCKLRTSEGWQGLDRLARLALRQANFIEALQIQPELQRGPEEMCQAQGGVAGDGAVSVEDFGNAVGRNVEPARQLGGAHLQLAQFLGQVFAGMNWIGWHKHILDAAFGDCDNMQIPRLRLAKRQPPLGMANRERS